MRLLDTLPTRAFTNKLIMRNNKKRRKHEKAESLTQELKIGDHELSSFSFNAVLFKDGDVSPLCSPQYAARRREIKPSTASTRFTLAARTCH